MIRTPQQSTTVRIDRQTHDRLRRLATESGQTIGETLAEAVRRLRQERMGDALVDCQSDADDERWLYGDASG